MKERKTSGYVRVAVYGAGFHHATYVPINSVTQVTDIESRVTYTRSLVASRAALPPSAPLGAGQLDEPF